MQLFSILNDRTFDNLIDRERWTIGGLSPDNWKGTVREEEVYKDISLAKIYSASDGRMKGERESNARQNCVGS